MNFNKFIAWFALSTANPQDAALTVRGILVMLSPFLTVSLGLLHVPNPTDSLSAIIDALVNVIADFFILAGACMTLIGIVRKISATLLGNHWALTVSPTVAQ